MVRWVAYNEQQAASGIPENNEGEMTPERIGRQKYLWNTGFHFGDWLIPSMTAGYSNPFESAKATKELVACCFFCLQHRIAGTNCHTDAQNDGLELEIGSGKNSFNW